MKNFDFRGVILQKMRYHEIASFCFPAAGGRTSSPPFARPLPA